jgi:hypothetical protein
VNHSPGAGGWGKKGEEKEEEDEAGKATTDYTDSRITQIRTDKRRSTLFSAIPGVSDLVGFPAVSYISSYPRNP